MYFRKYPRGQTDTQTCSSQYFATAPSSEETKLNFRYAKYLFHLNVCKELVSFKCQTKVEIIYTVSQKETIHLTIDHNFGNVDQFSKFFTDRFKRKLSVWLLQHLPPYLNYVVTLPCET